jgi:uncharacterized protein (TIGR03066 family)
MRAVVATLLILTPALVAAPVPKAKAPTLEQKLLGKWKMVASRGQAVPNSTFHFVMQKDGELEFRYEGRGNGTVYKGSYKVGEATDENKLGTIEWRINQNGSERGETSRITELSDDILEFKDPEGVVERFERVKEKEDEKKDK